MRILQVHNFYSQYGGECRVVEAERILLENAGHEVIPFYKFSDSIKTKGIIYKSKIPINTIHNTSILNELHSICADKRPDIAHIHNVFPLISPSVYSYLGKLNVPIVQSIHNYRFICPNGLLFVNNEVCQSCLHTKSFWPAIKKSCFHNSRILSAIYSISVIYLRNQINNISTFIAISNFIGDKLIEGGVPKEKIKVCGNFLEKSKVADQIYPKGDYYLYIGRLSEEKGIGTLISALRKVTAKTIIAGDGPLLSEINNVIEKYGMKHVQCLGFVKGEKKNELIAKANALIVPSLCYENFPMAVVESMSQGTPVIASKIGGLQEMIINNYTGILFAPGNVNELANSISRLSRFPDLADYLGKNALKYAIDNYSETTHLKKILDIYSNVITDT